MKTIYFTVTNDLTYDQRMHRICTSLANKGYNVTLVGRRLNTSLPLQQQAFKQKRLTCFFNKGFLFYAEYNLRLFFFLFLKKMDAICAVDLDTILPCLLVSKIKRAKRVYDAHEYFTEMKEVQTRPFVKKVWKWIEKRCVPNFKYGYTVSNGLSEAFKKEYNRAYEVIRNMPVLKPIKQQASTERILLYQGAVNEGRGFEYLIPAMKNIRYKLVVCGDGNFMDQLKELIRRHGVENKVELKGMMLPRELWMEAQRATLGMALAEKEGLNQYMALPNKFFDYMHAGLPQIAMNFPEYRKINGQFRVAILLDELSVEAVVQAINQTMEDENLLKELEKNCLVARELFHWQSEEKKLISFYQSLLPL